MITLRSPLPSYVEAARRQMERYSKRMTAIEAKAEREKKRCLDERRASEAAESVERVAEKLRRQAELEVKAARPAKADAKITSVGIIPIGAILGSCAAFYGVPISSLVAEGRSKDIVKTRQIAMYLAKELTPRSLPDIGRRIGGRDHTTVLHGVRKIAALINSDLSLAAEVAAIRVRIGGGSRAGVSQNSVAARVRRRNARGGVTLYDEAKASPSNFTMTPWVSFDEQIFEADRLAHCSGPAGGRDARHAAGPVPLRVELMGERIGSCFVL